ncbi:MAG: 4Fe-4S binding protein [Candidatus Bathyarchaeia archaeon]
MPYFIDRNICIGCGACTTVCPTEAIDWVEVGPNDVRCEIIQRFCNECGVCAEWCVRKAIKKV